MTRTQRWAAMLAASAVLASGAVGARAQQPPVTLAFATLDSGSAWYIYGATMAEVLRRALPPGSNIDVKPRAGGVGNPRLVAKNETPLGFGFTPLLSTYGFGDSACGGQRFPPGTRHLAPAGPASSAESAGARPTAPAQ